jgi:hypothetical protein
MGLLFSPLNALPSFDICRVSNVTPVTTADLLYLCSLPVIVLSSQLEQMPLFKAIVSALINKGKKPTTGKDEFLSNPIIRLESAEAPERTGSGLSIMHVRQLLTGSH